MSKGKHMESARSLQPISPFEEGSKIAGPNSKIQALCHRRNINTKLDQLLKNIRYGNTSDIEQQVLSIQESFTGVEQYLSRTIQPKYYAHLRPRDSRVAEKVFVVPELLEVILKHLEIPELMRCFEVNRTFKATIESSIKLQTHLFLRLDPNLLKVRFPLKSRYIRGKEPAEINIQSRIGWTYALGPRWKAMHVRQPAIYKMNYHGFCKPESGRCRLSGKFPVTMILTSQSGLTIGELFEAVERMTEMHRACSPRLEDMDSIVSVTFRRVEESEQV